MWLRRVAWGAVVFALAAACGAGQQAGRLGMISGQVVEGQTGRDLAGMKGRGGAEGPPATRKKAGDRHSSGVGVSP